MFELAFPWILFAWPLPLVLWHFLSPVQPSVPVSLKVPFFDSVASLVHEKKKSLISFYQDYLLLIIWSLLILAVAGPRWVGQPHLLHQESHNIMLALDISGSMALPDMTSSGPPLSRLNTVKKAAETFINQRIGDRIGLILFGTRAYLQTPLSFDRQALLYQLKGAVVGLAGQTTSLGDALGLAIKRLEHAPAKGRVVILLTDGANNSGVLPPLKAAELAKLDNIKVYTIGISSEINTFQANDIFLNLNSTNDLDELTLQKIANITGGQYFRADDKQSLQTIYHTINRLETINQAHQPVRPREEYYPWPLGIAFLLFFYWLMTNVFWNRRVSQ